MSSSDGCRSIWGLGSGGGSRARRHGQAQRTEWSTERSAGTEIIRLRWGLPSWAPRRRALTPSYPNRKPDPHPPSPPGLPLCPHGRPRSLPLSSRGGAGSGPCRAAGPRCAGRCWERGGAERAAGAGLPWWAGKGSGGCAALRDRRRGMGLGMGRGARPPRVCGISLVTEESRCVMLTPPAP